jgi:hypothetical protein
MIKGRVIEQRMPVLKPQVNYRALGDLNVSMLKLFDSDPVRFYEIFKLGRKKKDKRSTSLIIGDLVDFYLLDCHGDDDNFNHRLDEKFALFEGKRGGGQVFELCDLLYQVTEECLGEDLVPTRSFEERFREVVDVIKKEEKYYKGEKNNFEKILADFHLNGYSYFQALFSNRGKTVVDLGLLDKAKNIALALMQDEFTKDIFYEDHNLERHTKFPIQWVYQTSTCEQACKSELDLLVIDHEKGFIYPKDLKTTYDNEAFEYGYIKYGYYLQAAFYRKAVVYWAQEIGLGDYFVAPMEFIVADTSFNNRRPVRYELTEADMKRAEQGFSLRGTYYKGIDQLVEEVCWAESTNIWNASKNVIDRKGILNLNLPYDL